MTWLFAVLIAGLPLFFLACGFLSLQEEGFIHVAIGVSAQWIIIGAIGVISVLITVAWLSKGTLRASIKDGRPILLPFRAAARCSNTSMLAVAYYVDKIAVLPSPGTAWRGEHLFIAASLDTANVKYAQHRWFRPQVDIQDLHQPQLEEYQRL